MARLSSRVSLEVSAKSCFFPPRLLTFFIAARHVAHFPPSCSSRGLASR